VDLHPIHTKSPLSQLLNNLKKSDRVLANLPGLPGRLLAILYIAAAALPMLTVVMTGVKPASALSEFGTALALTAPALLF
jgi:hypothetical protein